MIAYHLKFHKKSAAEELREQVENYFCCDI